MSNMLKTRSELVLSMAVFCFASTWGVPTAAQDARSPTIIKEENHTKLIFAPSVNTKAAILTYVEERHRVLDELSAMIPNQLMEAQISFKDYMNSEEILAHVRRYDIDVLALNIGWKDQVGGYELDNGETIAEALKTASFHQKRFTDELYESALRQSRDKASAEGSQEDLARHAAFLAHAAGLKSGFQRRGLLIYGLRVRGEAAELKSMRDMNNSVRLVDPLWFENEEQVMESSVRKVAIPISPYEFNKELRKPLP